MLYESYFEMQLLQIKFLKDNNSSLETTKQIYSLQQYNRVYTIWQ